MMRVCIHNIYYYISTNISRIRIVGRYIYLYNILLPIHTYKYFILLYYTNHLPINP